MEEDDGFFGFDTRLPNARHGPIQEYGDVELEQEDTYDALNDETFGGGIQNATDDDWEEEHEKLAESQSDLGRIMSSRAVQDVFLEDSYENSRPGPQPQSTGKLCVDGRVENLEYDHGSEDAASVAATMSKVILDDDDIDSILSRSINYSKSLEPKLFGRVSPPSSIFDADIGSPSRPSIWSTQPSDICKSAGSGHKTTRTASTLNGNMNSPSASTVHHYVQHRLFKTVEELERDLLRQTMPAALTMEELERKILCERSLAEGPLLCVKEDESILVAGHRPAPMCAIPSQTPHPNVQSPFTRLPPPMGMGLPPPPIRVRPIVPRSMPLRLPMPIAGMQLAGSTHMPSQPPWSPRINLDGDQQPMGSQSSGLPRESTERSLLSSTFPASVNEVLDEYAGLMSTKEKQWLMSIQINQLISDNPYVDDYYFSVLRLRCLGKLQQSGESNKESGARLIMPERARPETKTYAPTQFANSLGKLQIVTYTAPRRIIDAGISQTPTEFSQDPLVVAKETKKFKQVLLDIEKMYLWLLELEDAELRYDSLPQTVAAADYQQKLQSFLGLGDRLQQVMLVRKGKILILRAWSRLNQQFQEVVIRNLLMNCIVLTRRDIHDHILVRFLPLVNSVFSSQQDLRSLSSMALMIDAGQKNTGYVAVTSTKMGFDLISLILCRGTELWHQCSDYSVREQWGNFVSSIGVALLATPLPLQSDLGLLSVKPFRQAGIDEEKLDALASILKTLSGSTN